MRLNDTPSGYGWISIALHWLTAGFVLVMLYVGASIPSATGVYADKLRLHTSLAFVFYAALWFRIWWRFRVGHPGPLRRQKPLYFAIGKYLHLLLLLAIAGMLVSGPLLTWAGDYPLEVFGLFTVPSPFPPDPGLFAVALQAHITCATALAVGVGLHIAGAAKHFFIDNDGSIDKILIAAPTPDVTTFDGPDPGPDALRCHQER